MASWIIPEDFLCFISSNRDKRDSIIEFIKSQIYSDDYALDYFRDFWNCIYSIIFKSKSKFLEIFKEINLNKNIFF